MGKKTNAWYTLGEAQKATGIPRTRLDHACRVNRLPYRRTETGARLLSHDVIEKLRKDGLRGFPRPYDPITSSNEHEAGPSGETQLVGLTAQRERIEQKRGELEEMRLNRNLRQLKDQDAQERTERRAAAATERQAQAKQRAEAHHENQQLRLEEARQAEAREQAASEAEVYRIRRQWEVSWLDYALKLLPSDVPHNLELDVHQAVVEILPKLDADQPERLNHRLIQAAIDKTLRPWHKRKEIDKVIEQAPKELPFYARGWGTTPSEWDARAMRAAAEAIAQLGNEASIPEIRAAAIEAGNKVCAEYEVWKAGDDHLRASNKMVEWVLDGDNAREAVREALKKLPVGASRAQMENVRDAALAPFRAANRAAEDADGYLQHVAIYIEEVGNEETGDWDLGNCFERSLLATELKGKLRTALIQKLLKETLDLVEGHEFIEEWLDRELGLED
jgi:hypothetical protein